jgi:hypothetical protein
MIKPDAHIIDQAFVDFVGKLFAKLVINPNSDEAVETFRAGYAQARKARDLAMREIEAVQS